MKTFMRTSVPSRSARLTALAAVLALGGCGLDDQTIPELGGPSEQSIAIKL